MATTRPASPATAELPRRTLLRLGGAALAAPALARAAMAQVFPSRPITLVVPFPPGGNVDVVGRVLAERMREPLGQSIIVENVSGANGSIGIERVARARPDGFTIDLGFPGGHVLNRALYTLPYDPTNDFEPVAPLRAVRTQDTAGERSARADRLAQGQSRQGDRRDRHGRGPPRHGVLSEGIRDKLCPGAYRGTAPAMQDLVAGQIDFSFDLPIQLPLVRAGSLKAFAVTSEARLAAAPDIPTAGEAGLPSLSASNSASSPRRARRATSSTSLTRPPSRRSPIQRCGRVLRLSGSTSSRASARRRRRSARW
jgi:hypothetical protein